MKISLHKTNCLAPIYCIAGFYHVDFIFWLNFFAIIKSVWYLSCDKTCRMIFQLPLVSVIEVYWGKWLPYYIHLDLVGRRLHICPSLSQVLCTLQLLSNCYIAKSIINWLPHIQELRCASLLASIVLNKIMCQESKHSHDVIYSQNLF